MVFCARLLPYDSLRKLRRTPVRCNNKATVFAMARVHNGCEGLESPMLFRYPGQREGFVLAKQLKPQKALFLIKSVSRCFAPWPAFIRPHDDLYPDRRFAANTSVITGRQRKLALAVFLRTPQRRSDAGRRRSCLGLRPPPCDPLVVGQE